MHGIGEKVRKHLQNMESVLYRLNYCNGDNNDEYYVPACIPKAERMLYQAFKSMLAEHNLNLSLSNITKNYKAWKKNNYNDVDFRFKKKII